MFSLKYDEREGGVCWAPNPGIPPFSCKVEDPAKGTKLGGLKAYMEYKIHPQVSNTLLLLIESYSCDSDSRKSCGWSTLQTIRLVTRAISE